MDPTITAAWIGAGIGGGIGLLGIAGTVVTSVVSSINTRKATGQSVAAGTASTMATLDAAREARLWEKRAAAYEETLTGLLHRQAQRHFDLRKYRVVGDEEEQKLKQFYENYELPGVFEVQGRLAAYASDAVMDAFNASRVAHAKVKVEHGHRAVLQESARLAQAAGDLNIVPNRQKLSEANRQLDSALQTADAADQALIDVIRDELRSKPDAPMAHAMVMPAKHHRIWARNRE